jgi:hypothetical protein
VAAGAQVRFMMTRNTTELIKPLTLQTLSQRMVAPRQSTRPRNPRLIISGEHVWRRIQDAAPKVRQFRALFVATNGRGTESSNVHLSANQLRRSEK